MPISQTQKRSVYSQIGSGTGSCQMGASTETVVGRSLRFYRRKWEV